MFIDGTFECAGVIEFGIGAPSACSKPGEQVGDSRCCPEQGWRDTETRGQVLSVKGSCQVGPKVRERNRARIALVSDAPPAQIAPQCVEGKGIVLTRLI